MPLSPHAKVGIGWVICTLGGLYSFYLAKTAVEKQRYDNMKVRQRMRLANEGEYDQSYRKFPTKY